MRDMPYAKGWHAVRRKPSGKFEARWADENGLARGKCFLTETQARTYALTRAKEILDGSLGLTVPTKDIREAWDIFIGRYTDEGTVRIYTRHFEDCLTAHPELRVTGQLTKEFFERYNVELKDAGHNPGGRRHVLKTLKTFSRYCLEKNWLKVDPFFKFDLPKQEFEGRALLPDEFARMVSVDPQYDVDLWISRALRLGNPSMLRISQVWKLTPEDFKAPDELRITGIKGQDTVWIQLHPDALEVMQELLRITPAGARFFAKWPTEDSMRQSIRKKAKRVGLKGVRFHDAAKVTRISELDAAGWGIGDLSALSNTTKTTLAKHYIKADRRRAFQRYQTYGGPTNGVKTGVETAQGALDRAIAE